MSTVANIISLSRYTDGIRDQQQEGACKAFQMDAGVRMMSKMFGVDLEDFSTQQIYNDIRIKQNTFNTDSGSYASAAEWVAKNVGFAKESSFSYGQNNLYVVPSDSVHAEAAEFKVQGFTHAPTEGNVSFYSNYIGKMLMQGKPVLVDAYVHYGFGVDPNQFLNPINGGHAYLIVGINYTDRTYQVQNSWGTNWADGGYGTIKFSDIPGIGPTSGGPWGTAYQDLIGISTIDGFDGHSLLWTASRIEAARYYATILDRAGELSGIDFWASYDGVITNTQLADSLLNSAEGQAIYGNTTDEQFIERMYENVVGRHSDSSGMSFYLNYLSQGHSRGQLISGVIDGLSTSKNDINAYDFLANKTNLSAYVSITMQYQGGNDAATAYALDGVTSDANGLEVLKIGIHEVLYPNIV